MVNFYNQYVTCSNTATLADVAGEAAGRDGVGGTVSPRPLTWPLCAHRPYGLCEEGGRR